MLVAAGMNHHVPRVAIQAIGPVVVTLDKNKFISMKKPSKNTALCGQIYISSFLSIIILI